MQHIIDGNRTIIVAADVQDRMDLLNLASALKGTGVGGIKLGSLLAMQGLAECVQIVKDQIRTTFPIIYDHQKGGTDIPDMGAPFAQVLKRTGVDSVILFPLMGPATQKAWTEACLGEGLGVLVGGMMTHKQFLESEGGYITDNAPERIYRSACQQGVINFVVPGTKLEWVKKIREWIVAELGEGNFVLYAPGFITQGGDVSECGKVAGDYWHPIVGRDIYNKPSAKERREAAIALVQKLAPVPA